MDDGTAKQRFDICTGCENFISLTAQCKLCYCFMHLKTRIATAYCPDGKWQAVQEG